MRDAPSIQFILEDARRNGYPPGQQRAFVMAKVLEKARVVIVGSECPDLVAACKMTPAATMEQALELAANELGTTCECADRASCAAHTPRNHSENSLQ